MREEACMNSEKLLKELEENACLDLHKLYYANPDKRLVTQTTWADNSLISLRHGN